MLAGQINEILSKHPYWKQLDEHQKIIVFNISSNCYWDNFDTKLVHAVMPKGSIGFDNSVFNPQVIPQLPQMMLSAKSLSKLSEIDIDLSTTEFLKEFTDDQRITIYRIAVAKIAEAIKEQYKVENSIGEVKKSYVSIADISYVYRVYEPTSLSYIVKMVDVTIEYKVSSSNFKSMLDEPIVEYTIEDYATTIEKFSYLPELLISKISTPGKEYINVLPEASYGYTIMTVADQIQAVAEFASSSPVTTYNYILN